MKNSIATLAFGLIIIIACNDSVNDHAASGHTAAATEDAKGQIIPVTGNEVDTFKKSIKAYATKNINGRHINIYYHSPAVRNRIIWGGLVPYDQVWVTGAHNATFLETESGLVINGQSIPAGKYAFFTIPSKTEWTLILNKNWDQHLADEYDQKDDVLRWKVNVDSISNLQERLRYAIDQTGEYKGVFEMTWEKVKITVPFELQR